VVVDGAVEEAAGVEEATVGEVDPPQKKHNSNGELFINKIIMMMAGPWSGILLLQRIHREIDNPMPAALVEKSSLVVEEVDDLDGMVEVEAKHGASEEAAAVNKEESLRPMVGMPVLIVLQLHSRTQGMPTIEKAATQKTRSRPKMTVQRRQEMKGSI
jgi:hypothetical protein